MNRRRRPFWTPALELAWGLIAVTVFIVIIYLVVLSRQQDRAILEKLDQAAKPVVDVLAPWDDPIVTFDRGDRKLEILGQNLPADTLICLRFADGSRACGLLFQWLGTAPKPLWPGK